MDKDNLNIVSIMAELRARAATIWAVGSDTKGKTKARRRKGKTKRDAGERDWPFHTEGIARVDNEIGAEIDRLVVGRDFSTCTYEDTPENRKIWNGLAWDAFEAAEKAFKKSMVEGYFRTYWPLN